MMIVFLRIKTSFYQHTRYIVESLIIRAGERAFAVLTIEVEAGYIRTIRVVANPEKLTHV